MPVKYGNFLVEIRQILSSTGRNLLIQIVTIVLCLVNITGMSHKLTFENQHFFSLETKVPFFSDDLFRII